jgi:hypothetical protein
MIKTEYLLNQVNGLLKSYEKLARSTGENFNIFSVMGMESNEVKTHSAIIGELMNPGGSHNLGDKPLKLFIKLIIKPLYRKSDYDYGDFEDNFDFDFDSTFAKVEEFAGKINNEETEGGRIDIVIKDNFEKSFLIENKIYAGEQKNQLTRYKNSYSKAPILFLTLTGKDAESANDLEKNKDYFNISYEKDILLWLQECVKEAVKFPMLREVIYQYLNLIKKLTHQTINNELKMEISELIKNNYLAASAIADNYKLVKDEIITTFFNDVFKDIIVPNEGWLFSIEKLHGKKELYYLMYKKEWKGVFVYIRKDSDALYYGVTISDRTLIDESVIILKNKYENLKNLKSSGHSVIWSGDFCVKINSHKDVLSLIEEREEKLKITKEFITKLMGKYENLCNEIAKHISINISVDILN